MELFRPGIITGIFILFISTSAIAHVGLDFPSGGESFVIGEEVNIQWHIAVDHGDCDWDIFYSDDGGTNWSLVAEDIPKSTLSWDWTVSGITTDMGRIRVIQDNVSYTNFDDASGNFSVRTAHISTGSPAASIALVVLFLITGLIYLRLSRQRG